VGVNRILSTIVAIALCACDSRKASPPSVGTSYAFVDAGNPALPTNDLSQRLIALSGADRFDTLRQMVVRANHRCDAVSSALLTGGLDGTDTWRVQCNDCSTPIEINPLVQRQLEDNHSPVSFKACKAARSWAVWLYPNGNQEVVACQEGSCT